MLKTIYQKRIAFVSIFILIITLLPGWVFRPATSTMIDSDDEPELSKIETTLLSYKENDEPKVITTRITVEEGDDDRLVSAKVWISGNYQSQEDVLLFTNNYGITGTWNAETGILNLAGSSTVSKYQSALRSIKYFNRSNDPSVLVRKVSFIVNDGSANSNIVSRQITVTAVNDVPVLTNIETSPLGYTENDLNAFITGTLMVTDEDDLNLESAVVRISVNYQSGQDILTFKNTSSITGVWNSGTGILNLNGTSSIDSYQEALHSITYFNTSDNPSAVTRTISFRVNDGSENSATVSRQVTVTPVNDAPVAYSVTFRGSMTIESVLTGDYIYIDAEGDAEGSSTYKWFRANDISGAGEVSIPGATAKTYVLAAADADKYISFEVMPVASSGTTSGIAVKSARQHVITMPPGWDVIPSNYTYKGLVTARVFIVQGIAVESGILAAFVGEECRGIIEATYHPAPDQYLFELGCYSNKLSGDVLTFRYYDPVEDTVYNMDRSVDFVPDMSAGTSESPVKMNIGVDFIVSFPAGWSWFSVNSFLDNMTLGFILSSVVTNEDYIKSQESSATYYSGYGWFGSLKLIDTTRLYKVQVQNSCITKFSGRPVDVSSTHLALESGWNWIGYLPQVPLPVKTALSSLSLVDLDYLKNQKSSATYYTGYGWFGSLTTLYPAEGYMLRLSNPGTLTYPDSDKKGNNTIEDNNELQFKSADFEFNGSVTAKVLANGVPAGSENNLLFAFVNDEIRGVAVGLYFPPEDVWLYTLMIHSNLIEGEVVNFKYFDSEKNKYFPCKELITFSSDMIIADAFKSFELNVLGPYSNKEENIIQKLEMHVYPNPFKHNITIEYRIPDLNHVSIAVCDIYGKPVTLLIDQKLESGHYLIQWEPDAEPGGMYIIKLQAGERFKVQKVMLMP